MRHANSIMPKGPDARPIICLRCRRERRCERRREWAFRALLSSSLILRVVRVFRNGCSPGSARWAMGYFVLLRWPPGTPAQHAPDVVQRALAAPSTTTQTVYAILRRGMNHGHHDSGGGRASDSMAICIVATRHLGPALQEEIERALAGCALLWRYEDGPRGRAKSSVAWTRAPEIMLPSDELATLADLKDAGAIALLATIWACAERLGKDGNLQGEPGRKVRRALNNVEVGLLQALNVARQQKHHPQSSVTQKGEPLPPPLPPPLPRKAIGAWRGGGGRERVDGGCERGEGGCERGGGGRGSGSRTSPGGRRMCGLSKVGRCMRGDACCFSHACTEARSRSRSFGTGSDSSVGTECSRERRD